MSQCRIIEAKIEARLGIERLKKAFLGRKYRGKKLIIWLEQFNLIQGVGAKTVQIVRQATTTQDQIKLLQP